MKKFDVALDELLIEYLLLSSRFFFVMTKKVAVKMFRHQRRNTILFRYFETIVLE